MEVCRERGNIKLKSRPYTEVSKQHSNQIFRKTAKKIVLSLGFYKEAFCLAVYVSKLAEDA